MNRNEILGKVDHTLLSQTATWEEIRKLCDEGIKYRTASVCIPPVFVRQAKEYTKGALAVCTVVGFPNGYQSPAVKLFECMDALNNGADEIDMVLNLGWVKAGRFERVAQEIKEMKKMCGGHILKVIVEACLLTEEEKIKLCGIVSECDADYIKTSTGFSTGGATLEDVALFAKHIGSHVKIKAAGGIATFEEAEEFIRLGASRLGTSRLVKLALQEEQEANGAD